MGLKRLLSLRERLVKRRSGFKASLKEQKRVLPKKENEVFLSTQEKMIKYLSKQISVVEKQMEGIIKKDESMSRNFTLLNTIKGVGPQTALFMIAYTANFTKFKDWRKFASYCGIAPFANVSGTSIRGRTKVSNLTNKKIKKPTGSVCKIQHTVQCRNETVLQPQDRVGKKQNEHHKYRAKQIGI